MRCPLEAVSSSKCGPTRAVRLGLGQRTVEAFVARPIRPCYAESSPLRQASPLSQFSFRMQALLSNGHDANSRDSCAPLPNCRISQVIAPSSPAIAVSATFCREQRWRHRTALGGVPWQSPNPPKADRRQSRRRRPGQLLRVSLSVPASAGGQPSPAVCRAGSRRSTGPRPMADSKRSQNCS